MLKIDLNKEMAKQSVEGFLFALLYTFIFLLGYVFGFKDGLPGEKTLVAGTPSEVELKEVEQAEGVEVKEENIESQVKAPVRQKTKGDGVWRFIQNYPGARIDYDFYEILKTTCNDDHLLKLAVGISVSEGGIGSRGLPATKQSNFWNYFKGGNRAYDPSKKVMAQDICTSLKTNYWEVDTSFHQAKYYVIGHRPCKATACIQEVKTWMYNLNRSIESMR